MRNQVEILRALCYTYDDLKTIQNLGDSFSEKEIEFMVEFKKIYELGLDQLKVFIDKLDEEGDELDAYSIQYYVDVLFNGPLGSHTRELSKDKKYFPDTPEGMGRNGNNANSSPNTTLYETLYYPLGAPVDIHNKVPAFTQELIKTAVEQADEVFRSGFRSSMVHDNTLPIIDKAPQQRYVEEPKGGWELAPNGSYLVKDRYFKLAIEEVSQDIFDSVKAYLGDENFRLWADKKTFFPFDSSKNTSTGTNNKIEKEFTENSETIVITVDLMGDVFDSEEKRATILKVENDSKDKEYTLNTNEGQLGNPL